MPGHDHDIGTRNGDVYKRQIVVSQFQPVPPPNHDAMVAGNRIILEAKSAGITDVYKRQAATPAPTKEEVLLTEIRDLLKEQNNRS